MNKKLLAANWLLWAFLLPIGYLPLKVYFGVGQSFVWARYVLLLMPLAASVIYSAGEGLSKITGRKLRIVSGTLLLMLPVMLVAGYFVGRDTLIFAYNGNMTWFVSFAWKRSLFMGAIHCLGLLFIVKGGKIVSNAQELQGWTDIPWHMKPKTLGTLCMLVGAYFLFQTLFALTVNCCILFLSGNAAYLCMRTESWLRKQAKRDK